MTVHILVEKMTVHYNVKAVMMLQSLSCNSRSTYSISIPAIGSLASAKMYHWPDHFAVLPSHYLSKILIRSLPFLFFTVFVNHDWTMELFGEFFKNTDTLGFTFQWIWFWLFWHVVLACGFLKVPEVILMCGQSCGAALERILPDTIRLAHLWF